MTTTSPVRSGAPSATGTGVGAGVGVAVGTGVGSACVVSVAAAVVCSKVVSTASVGAGTEEALILSLLRYTSTPTTPTNTRAIAA